MNRHAHTSTHVHTHVPTCSLFHVGRKVKVREWEIDLTTDLAGKESIESEPLQVDAKNLKDWTVNCSGHYTTATKWKHVDVPSDSKPY